MTPAEQIAAMRKMTKRGVPAWLLRSLTVLAAILTVAWLITQHSVYLIPLAFVAAVISSIRQVAPHLINATKAFDHGVQAKGIVLITVKRWSDSNSYHASIQVSPSHDWSFEFIPLSWQPTEGTHEATLFRLPGVEWPALVEFEQGFAYPRQIPKLQPHADA